MKDWPWENFYPEEFKCRCNDCDSDGYEMKSCFMGKLVILRRVLGNPIFITSGYRCKKYNSLISKTGSEGAHLTGRAADIKISLVDAYEAVRVGFNVGFTRIGLKQSGDIKGRFIHFDDLKSSDGFPSPRIWTYS